MTLEYVFTTLGDFFIQIMKLEIIVFEFTFTLWQLMIYGAILYFALWLIYKTFD